MTLTHHDHPDDIAHRAHVVAEIRQMRLDAGLSMREAAIPIHAAGGPAAWQSIWNWEAGGTSGNPMVHQVLLRARAFGAFARPAIRGLEWHSTPAIDLAARRVAATTGPDQDGWQVALVVAQLAAARHEADVSLRQLAARIGRGKAAVCAIEAGTSAPSMRTLQRRARGLGGRMVIEFWRAA